MKTPFVAIYILLFKAVCAATPNMAPYTIDLLDHTLRFSLPAEVARDVLPYKPILTSFDPLDPAYFRNDAKTFVDILHVFKGPLFHAAYGGLSVRVTIIRRVQEYSSEIRTPDGLQRYIIWVLTKHQFPIPVDFDQRIMNGRTLVHRWNSSYLNETLHEIDDLEVFSFPLSDDAFLDVEFTISDWQRGNRSKWNPQALELREAIKSTLVVDDKKSGNNSEEDARHANARK